MLRTQIINLSQGHLHFRTSQLHTDWFYSVSVSVWSSPPQNRVERPHRWQSGFMLTERRNLPSNRAPCDVKQTHTEGRVFDLQAMEKFVQL
jgi:hypothetical protein